MQYTVFKVYGALMSILTLAIASTVAYRWNTMDGTSKTVAGAFIALGIMGITIVVRQYLFCKAIDKENEQLRSFNRTRQHAKAGL